jgi:superfamily II DNA/RNA helicase
MSNGQSTDTGIFTNDGTPLINRFLTVMRSVQALDVVVGYFRMSGFERLHEALADVEKIRILVGLNVDTQTFQLVDKIREETVEQLTVFSTQEVIATYSKVLDDELDGAVDERLVRASYRLFLQLLRSGRLEIKVHKEQKIHAKVYIMRNKSTADDYGRVITGSSNFSANGFSDQFEFNVELKDKRSYDAAEAIFEKWWLDGVDISQVYVDAAKKPTVVSDSITPYEIYLKFLVEYFRHHLINPVEIRPPSGFLKLRYQIDAVVTAHQILETYGGVFLADVVGLGKTYMAGMLALALDKPCLVIAPPKLLNEKSEGSWVNVLRKMGVRGYKCVSLGKLEETLNTGTEEFGYVIIDESHRFKSSDTERYELLSEICRGKGVILLSATPYNNEPSDVLNQLKLFQDSRQSTIPRTRNLDEFFNGLRNRTININRLTHPNEYLTAARKNAQDLRDRILRYVMVRRTRSEIATYYADDLRAQNIVFPEVRDPIPLFYVLTPLEDKIYENTTKLLDLGGLTYARYMPLSTLYFTGDPGSMADQAARNLAGFMRILLIKRLESSFTAFKMTLQRFISSYRAMLTSYDSGWVYVSKRQARKIEELILEGDFESIDALLQEDDAAKYPANMFRPGFRDALVADLNKLEDVAADWNELKRDPKWDHFSEILQGKPVLDDLGGVDLRTAKIIVFSEFADTAQNLANQLKTIEPRTLFYSSDSEEAVRTNVILNFDASTKKAEQRDDFRILVTTDVLAEGVNLHRSHVVVNYDLPWNPSKMMQRVGRINRIGTQFPVLHSYNFFPTTQGDSRIALTEAARTKIAAFIALLGNDARLLDHDENIETHGYFETFGLESHTTGDESHAKSELFYLNKIKNIKENDNELYQRILAIRKRVSSARQTKPGQQIRALSYIRHGELDRFWISDDTAAAREADFFEIVGLLHAEPTEQRTSLNDRVYYALLDQHKDEERKVRELEKNTSTQLSGNAQRILARLKDRNFRIAVSTNLKQQMLVNRVMMAISAGRVLSRMLSRIYEELQHTNDPEKMLDILVTHIPTAFLEDAKRDNPANAGYDGVVLGEYFSER